MLVLSNADSRLLSLNLPQRVGRLQVDRLRLLGTAVAAHSQTTHRSRRARDRDLPHRCMVHAPASAVSSWSAFVRCVATVTMPHNQRTILYVHHTRKVCRMLCRVGLYILSWLACHMTCALINAACCVVGLCAVLVCLMPCVLVYVECYIARGM